MKQRYNYKGGYINKSGYRMIYSKHVKHYVFEHRIILEKKLARKLLKNEICHHKNHIKLDNRPENLEVMTRREHVIKHNGARGTCSFKECNRKHFGRSYCSLHYMRFIKHGDPNKVLRIHSFFKKKCPVIGCKKIQVLYGYCTNHGRNFKSHGDPLKNRRNMKCNLCDRNFYSKGLCLHHHLHYSHPQPHLLFF